MDPILDYLDINTIDIWTFEANQYLSKKRTHEQIIKVKSELEHEIVMSRRQQINKNLTVTINPIVTIDDYDNGTNKDYWVRARHTNQHVLMRLGPENQPWHQYQME